MKAPVVNHIASDELECADAPQAGSAGGAAWIARIRRPRLMLVALCALVYGPTLGDGFLLDDYHHLTRLEALRRGERDAPELYRFLIGDASNAAVRRSGEYPWWITDEVRYQHWRPAAEWMLYGEYLLFGHVAWAYRLVNLALYAAGVCLVLSLFERLTDDIAAARCGAFLFAILASHAIPVVFISSQADMVALVLLVGAIMAALRFAGTAPAVLAVVASVLFGLCLGFKEAALPAAVLPALLAWTREGRERRRLLAVSGLWLVLSAGWLALYVRGGYGANNAAMLDPIRAPLHYLAAMPGRALILLAALILPVNPFIFYLRPGVEVALVGFAVAGSVCFAALAGSLWRRTSSRLVNAMILWPLPFLPLLACTVPDDRVLMLPGIGFALMLGAWWSLARRSRPRLAAFVLGGLALAHGLTSIAAAQIMGHIARDGRWNVRQVESHLGRPLSNDDCIFFLNSGIDAQVLFVQHRFRWETDAPNLRATFLTCIERPVIEVLDERTLVISAASGGVVDGFLGRMGASHRREIQTGDAFDAGEFEVRVLDATGTQVRRIEASFSRPLSDEHYHFFMVASDGTLTPWQAK